jgi:hypothetical protein
LNSPSFQSYTPRVKNLNYDALALNLGCQDISGEEFRNFAPLSRICVAEHDEAVSSYFSKIATVAFARGPSTTGLTEHFHTRWVAWVGSSSVRVKKGWAGYSAPTPINTAGEQSQLFPATKPSSLSLAFSNEGQMAIAAQTATDTITLRRYTDAIGTVAQIVFTGRSPLLWQTGELGGGSDLTRNELVLLYLLPERPTVIFGRFESENFTTVHEIVEDLPVNLSSLNQAEATRDGKLLISARNDIERDISIYSSVYAIYDRDDATLALVFDTGFYFDAAEEVDAGEDDATLQLAFDSGFYFTATESAGAISADNSTLSLAWSTGEYS